MYKFVIHMRKYSASVFVMQTHYMLFVDMLQQMCEQADERLKTGAGAAATQSGVCILVASA